MTRTHRGRIPALSRKRPPARKGPTGFIVAVVVVAATATAIWAWRPASEQRRTDPVDGSRHEQLASVAPAARVAAWAPTTSGPELPVPAASLAAGEVEAALANLVGRKAVLTYLQSTDFPRRLVATLDNLAREHAPTAVWPVLPTPGRFLVEDVHGERRIAAANEARYRPLVAFVTSLDAARVVDLYWRMYPLLQNASAELGPGQRRLHDRVLATIELLLATPEPARSPAVRLTHVKGSYAARQPWTRYEFADPQLQSLPAGQKMLLRVGNHNRALLKRKLRDLRDALALPTSGEPRR